MSKPVKFIIIVLLFGVLAVIRFFENDLFYDPYLEFFKNDYLYMDNPRRKVFKLTFFTSLRYAINTVVSLGILFVFFKDKNMIKFAGVIYAAAYCMLLALFLYFVLNPRQEDYYMFFNIRRFLIQPIILLLLLPAFYYHKLKQ